MYINTKKVIRDNGVITVRVKSLNWQGTIFGLEINGEIVRRGTRTEIIERYEKY